MDQVLTCCSDVLWPEFPIFKATIALPPGAKLEYKYVVARAEKTKDGVQSQWEASNRLFTVPQYVVYPQCPSASNSVSESVERLEHPHLPSLALTSLLSPLPRLD